jgi:hypothetical protein
MQEVRLVDKKYRLNVLRDKVKAVLDTIGAQEVADPNLAAQIKGFVEKFDQAYQGEGGLLSIRAEMLANPQHAKAKEQFDEKAKALNGSSRPWDRACWKRSTRWSCRYKWRTRT